MMLEVFDELDDRHPATAELPLDQVAVGKGGLKAT
jgi:hypothetical protein